MKRLLPLTILIIACNNISVGQSVGIGGSAFTPSAYSILEMRSDSMGVLLPRLSNTDRAHITPSLGMPHQGLTIYNKDTDLYNYWDGTTWVVMSTTSGAYVENQNGYQQIADFNIGGDGIMTKMGVGTGLAPLGGQSHFHDGDPSGGNIMILVDDNVGNPLMSVIDYGHIGFGTSTPSNNAIIDVTSNKGVLLPRMDETARLGYGGALGVLDDGMIVYDSTHHEFFWWDGPALAWNAMGPMTGSYIENQNTALQPADYRIAGLGVASQMGVGTGMGAILGSHHIHDANFLAGNQLLYVDDYVGKPIVSVIDEGRVGIGTSTPNPHAALEVEDTLRGVLLPRMTSAQKSVLGGSMGATDAGMMVYDSTLHEYNWWDGSAWVGTTPTTGMFIDNQYTGVQTADFNIGGVGVVNKLGVGTGLGPVIGLTHIKDNSPTAGSRLMNIEDWAGLPLMTVVDGGQVGLGTTAPNASAILDLSTTTKGFLPPRMLQAQRVALPNVQGMVVYQTNTPFEGLWYNDGAAWHHIASSSFALTSLEDTDGDTKVEVEQSTDEDIVRFTTHGTEYLNMSGGRLNVTNTGESTFLGKGAGENDDLSSNRNVAIGHDALKTTTTGWDNTAIGHEALRDNVDGYSNTAAGKEALAANDDGYANTALGKYAMSSNTSGYLNTSVGMNSLPSLTDGHSNTAVGYSSLYLSTTGYENTAIGHGAGHLITTGYQNTCLGKTTNVGATVNNSTAIGYGAHPTTSNTIQLGNSSVTSIGGYAAWTNLSDERCKQNIVANVPGLEFVTKLRPVTYNMDLDALAAIKGTPDSARSMKDERAKEEILYTGLIAQEVEQAAKAIDFDFSGIDAPENENDHYSLRYAEFVVPLIQAIQELNQMNRDLKMEVEVLRKQVVNIQTTASK